MSRGRLGSRQKYIPESLKAELTQLKALRREQTSRLKNGSQKAFFMRVWARLHGMPVLPPSSAVDTKKPETGSKSKSSTSKNTHVLNFDAKGSNEFDAHDIRALLESKSTFSSMPSVDESITKHATQDSEALDLDIRKSDSDLNLRANQSEASADNIAITESKSSLSSMALNMSTFSVYCKEEEEGSGSSQIV